MQFGWDFAPRLRTCGIWDDAWVTIARSVFIEDAQIKAKGKSEKAKVASIQVALTLDSDREQNVRVACNVRGKNFESAAQTFDFDLNLTRGTQVREIAFDLQDARLWNPWDRGEPNLYELAVVIARSEVSGAERSRSKPAPSRDGGAASQTPLAMSKDTLLDSSATTFGIREFELTRTPHSPITNESWQFVINGQREFLRGANWVPLDAIPARLTRDDYAARLRQARDANVNFLRVWGGGLREKRAFYDLCDEMGILVWQEFPFSGTLLDRFPHDRAFLQFVCAECGDIVRALRNHPSLVVWCGGNEFGPRGNAAIVKKLRAVVKDKDGTRPFKPASPYRDESHNWRAWHRFANLRDYRNDATPFLSEFGLQAMPNLESLKRFLPVEALSAPHALWEYHCAELKKLGRYAQPPLLSLQGALSAPKPPPSRALGTPALHQTQRGASVISHKPFALTIEEFIDATQRAQALGLQIAIEHMRRRKPRTSGVAVWQFNDPWPAISWSVVDYYGAPKRAYYELQKLYSPVLASFDYALIPRRAGDVVCGDVWLINDLGAAYLNAELSAYLNGNPVYARRVNIEPDSSACVDALQIRLGAGENLLRLIVRDENRVLSDHAYDLNFCDVGEISRLGAVMVAVATRLMK